MNSKMRLKNYTEENIMWKQHIENEEKTNKGWEDKWGWLKKVYDELHQQQAEHTAKSNVLKRVYIEEKPDPRQPGPWPDSTNHMYGYLAKNPEFKLEVYGPDQVRPLPLPSGFKLNFDV